MTNLLHCSEIGFSYATEVVLSGINLSLEAGTCSALIGANGSGKTTLLRILAGTLKASSGQVLIWNQALDRLQRRARARLIALVPQQLDVPFDFTVRQIVEQGRAPYLQLLRGLVQEDRLVVDRAMDQADVFILKDRIFNELSGGERQRVKIALGLAQQPMLLLLDEPTQNLDIGRQAELIDLLHSLCGQGITVFASIHDIHLVPNNFETVHLIEPGRRLTSGSPRQVLTTTHLSRAFRFDAVHHSLHMPMTVGQVSS